MTEDLTHVVMNDDADDLSKDTKTTLGDYLQASLDDSSNVFFPPSESEEISLIDPDRHRTPSQTVSISDPGSFMHDARKVDAFHYQDAITHFHHQGAVAGAGVGAKPISPNFELDSGEEIIDKNLRDVGNNTLLSQFLPYGGYRGSGGGAATKGELILTEPPELQKRLDDDPDDVAARLQKNISNILQINRFSPSGDTPFIRNGTPSEVMAHIQGELGVYTAVVDDSHPEVSTEDLQDLAIKMLLNATHHKDESAGASMTSLMIPGDGWTGQMALPTTYMSMADVNPLGVAQDLGLFGTNNKFQIQSSKVKLDYQRTWGQLNSPNEPFSGPFPAGMILLAALMIVAILLVAIVIQLIVSIFSGPSGSWGTPASFKGQGSIGDAIPQPTPTPKVWKGIKGDHVPVADYGYDFFSGMGNKLMDMFGIPHTHHNWAACFPVGIEAFYGFAEGGLSGLIAGGSYNVSANSILDMIENIFASSGYYAGIMRAVARDMVQIEEAFAIFSDSDVGFVKGFGAALQVVQSITTSITWRFIMNMAIVGDKILDDKYQYFNPVGIIPADDKLPIPHHRLQKSRRGIRIGGGNELVWSNNSALSLYLLPKGLQDATTTAKKYALHGSSMLKAPGAALAAHALAEMTHKDEDITTSAAADLMAAAPAMQRSRYANRGVDNGIIDPAFVKAMEAQLEGEFCPFYFQDLRTNEILTFHAFITSLTESFAPAWNALEAYGRMDDVMILQKTTRTLTLSFVVAATNETDLSGMWYKLNRLVSMVYPQWSDGKLMQVGKHKFRMPFSQIPTASPVVRMRIGDLVSSNYSRFGLMRLFGLGEAGVVASFKDAAGAATTPAVEQSTNDEAASSSANQQNTAETALQDEQGKLVSPAKVVANEDIANVPVVEEKSLLEQAADAAGAGAPTPTISKIPAGTIMAVVESKPISGEGGATSNPSTAAVQPAAEDAGKAQTPSAPALKSPELAGRWLYKLTINTKAQSQQEGGGANIPDKNKEYTVLLDPNKVALKLHIDTVSPSPEPADPAPPVPPEDIGLKDFFAGGNDVSDGSKQNPIVRAFESTRGSGLAGVITSINFTYSDSPWESRIHSKAPIWTTVDMGFTVIHDLTPGLAADGSLRAPTHPVGELIKNTHGSVYTDQHYKKAWGLTTDEWGKSPAEVAENDEVKTPSGPSSPI